MMDKCHIFRLIPDPCVPLYETLQGLEENLDKDMECHSAKHDIKK